MFVCRMSFSNAAIISDVAPLETFQPHRVGMHARQASRDVCSTCASPQLTSHTDDLFSVESRGHEYRGCCTW
jgi:hypothetical protein